jgi:hypothetical protein
MHERKSHVITKGHNLLLRFFSQYYSVPKQLTALTINMNFPTVVFKWFSLIRENDYEQKMFPDKMKTRLYITSNGIEDSKLIY